MKHLIETFTVLILLNSFHSGNHYFEIDSIQSGALAPLKKGKKVKIDLGEDSFLTSPVGLVVCDGVGGHDFSSKHISLYLSIYYQKAIMTKEKENHNEHSDENEFNKFIYDELLKGVAAYKKIVDEEYEKWKNIQIAKNKDFKEKEN